MECDDFYVVQSYDDLHTVVNIPLLQTHPLIQNEDARIFRWISGLEPHPSMLKTSTTSLHETVQNMFTNYRIRRYDWMSLTGFLLSPITYKYKSTCGIFDMCLVIGLYSVVLALDTEKTTASSTTNSQYNPMTPDTDWRQMYWWQLRDTTFALPTGWSATVRQGGHVYYRKKRSRDEME